MFAKVLYYPLYQVDFVILGFHETVQVYTFVFHRHNLATMGHPKTEEQEPIAIIGAACRFAGEVSSLESLWELISKVKTGHGPVPADRWDSSHWYHPDPDRKGGINTQHGYFLDQDISQFDAPFFSVTAKEAASMDPMMRLLLEVSYESIENGMCYP